MKRKSLILVFYILITINLFAANIERMFIGTGNDMWTFGLSRNDDDQLSYSGFVLVQTDKSDISLEFQGITNRGYREGWTPGSSIYSDNQYYRGRYDSALLLYEINKTNNIRNISIISEFGFGAQIIGKLGFDYFQNSNHETLKIHDVQLPYDTSSIFIYPYLSMNTNIMANLQFYDSSKLQLGGYVDFYNSINFEKGYSYGTKIAVNRNDRDVLYLKLGLGNNINKSNLNTAELFSQYRNKTKAELYIDTGILFIDYLSYINTGYGFTRVGMNVIKPSNAFMWKCSDIHLGLGMTYMMNDSLWTIRACFPIKESKFTFFIENRNITGYPINIKTELTSDINATGRLKKEINGAFAGVSLKLNKKLFEAYANASLGFMDFKVYSLLNTIEDSYYPYEDLGKTTSFACDLSIGITLIPEWLIVNSYTSYRVSVEGGITILENPERAMDLMTEYDSVEKKKLGTLVPKLTVLLAVGLDL